MRCTLCGGSGVIRLVTWTQYDTAVKPPPGAPVMVIPCRCRAYMWPIY
jgi:hypothetical protein